MDLLNRNIHATDPNENYEVLEQTLKEVYNESFPERIVRFNVKKHKKTPWITTGILNSINRRNKLYKVLKQTKTDAISYETKNQILIDIEIFQAVQVYKCLNAPMYKCTGVYEVYRRCIDVQVYGCAGV